MKRRSQALHHEVAEAYRAKAGKQRTHSTGGIVASARALARLLTKHGRARRELRLLESDIRHEWKMLKALAGAHGGDDL